VRGVLIPHRHLQLRFYSRSAPPKELYSIYTPSKQGGLIAHDLDGDGRTDLLWGNYWLRHPDTSDGHWRLFAINTYFELEDSALARLAWSGKGLYWGAATGAPRLVFLSPGEDIRQLWTAQPLPDAPAGITALLAAGDGLVAAHAGGVTLYQRSGAGFSRSELSRERACALFERQGAVWAVFDDGPREVYRRR
jgi:hypothetical protein